MQSFRRLTTSSAIRSSIHSPATSPRHFVRRLTQNSGQGGSYASTGRTHGNMGAKGSDVPWMIGSVAFTVPAAFYLLSSSPKPTHHSPPGHGHDAKAAKTEDSDAPSAVPEEEAPSDETEDTKQDIKGSASSARDKAYEAKEKASEKAGEVYGEAKKKAESSAKEVTDTAAAVKDKASETAKSKADEYTGGKGSEQDEPEDSKEKVKKATNEVNEKVKEKVGKKDESESESESKVPVKEGKKAEKNESESKGETKSQVLERLNKEQSKKPSDIDSPAAALKGPTSTNMQTGKQEGLSNQDTWHSILHSERGQAISKKAEGSHDSAKLKGTVDPSRPAVPADHDSKKK